MVYLNEVPNEGAPLESTNAKSHIETVKEESHGLSGIIRNEPRNPKADFGDDNAAWLEFHGIYQRVNRDLRRAAGRDGKHAPTVFMVRAKFPSGRITPEQCLLCNALAGKYADGDLRITCREDIQFHGAPYNTLYDKGDTSIGCEIRTTPTRPTEDNHAGQWRWQSRTRSRKSAASLRKAAAFMDRANPGEWNGITPKNPC
jgi:hypothetical protein